MRTLILSVGLFSAVAAAETRKLSFESPSDHFELVLKDGAGSVADKPADLSALNDILPALTNDVSNACPEGLKERPDLTVREGARTRRVYIGRGLVALDDACLNVGGAGLFFMPIHRDFLIGPRQDGLDLKGELEISRDGAKLVTLKQHGDGWASTDPKRLVNRDFFDRFVNTLTSFNVRTRVGLGLAKGQRRVGVKSNGRLYEFYRLPGLSWGLKKPGAKWLVASDDWSFWDNFDDETIDDRFAQPITTAGDPAEPTPARAAALAKLEGAWSPNLRALYHRLVREEPGDDALKLTALKRLKRKPSLESAGVMIDVLASDAGEDVKRDAAIILKLQNPKGPKYAPKASAAERAKTIEFWRQWWKEQKP